MKIFFLVILGMFFPVIQTAQADPNDNTVPPAVEQAQPPVPQPVPAAPPRPSTRSEDWPKPFKPTERITADSAVSFPADI